MFCANLRRRRSFVSIIPTLTSPTGLNLRENLLETHDLELTVPSSNSLSNDPPRRRIRILLLSQPACITTALTETLSRIERLSNQTGGRDVLIVFLLSRAAPNTTSPSPALPFSRHQDHPTTDSNPASYSAGITALAQLQAALLEQSPHSAIPVLPLPSLQYLAPLLSQYIAILGRRPAPSSVEAGNNHNVLELLAQCTVNPPLSRQQAYVVSDLVPSFRALARCAMLHGSEVGEGETEYVGPREVAREQVARLGEFLGEGVVRGMMEFWREEWVAE